MRSVWESAGAGIGRPISSTVVSGRIVDIGSRKPVSDGMYSTPSTQWEVNTSTNRKEPSLIFSRTLSRVPDPRRTTQPSSRRTLSTR